MGQQLIFNSVICLSCGEQLISRHRHHFVKCSCSNETYNDGGLSYQRFGGKDLSLIQSHCFYDTDDFETVRFYLERYSTGKNFDEEPKYIKLKNMSDEHLENVIKYIKEYGGDFIDIYKKEQKYRKKNYNEKNR